MATKIDLKQYSPEVKRRIMTLVQERIDLALAHEELDWVRSMVDVGIHQQYDYADIIRTSLTNATTESVKAEILALQEEENESDEFSHLKVPLLYKLHRGWVTYIKNAVFPANGDWIEIKRENHPVLDDLGLNDFMELANECWVNILKTENQQFQFKKKYSSGIAEYSAYGTTGCVHYYDDEAHYVDVRFPGIGNFGIYPLSDRWRESTIVVQYDVNYHDLKNRSDFDQEAVAKIRPAPGTFGDGGAAETANQRNMWRRSSTVPADKVRMHDVYFPVLYIPEQGSDEEILLEKVFITVAINPNLKKSYVDSVDSENIDLGFIVKASIDVERYEHGINLANFGETLPGVFYHKGPLIPFIPDQLQLNQIKAGVSRIVAMLCDPPLGLEKTDGDFQQTPPERLEPGATYEGYKVTSLVPPEYGMVIQQFKEYYRYVVEEVEEASGMSRTQLGMPLQSRRSATEVREFSSGGAASVSEAATVFDDEMLRPSIANRIQLSQRICVEQVEYEIENMMNSDPTSYQENQVGEKLPRPEAYDKVLRENKLYTRLKTFSGIKRLYTEFKNQVDKKILEDQAIINELQAMTMQMQQSIQFAQSPIQPFVPNPNVPQPAPGEEAEGAGENQMAQMYYQQEEMRRQQAKQQAEMLSLAIPMKKMQLTNSQPVPEPSDYLYYEILTADISDSDIEVTGSRAALSKDLALKAATTILEAGAKVPEIARELDFKSVLADLAKATGKSINDITKSVSEKAKDEEKMRQQEAMQQQMAMMGQQQPQ